MTRSSPHCGELSFVESEPGCFADSVARHFASISTNTIPLPSFLVSPTIVEIEYGAIPACFIAGVRFTVARVRNAGLQRKLAAFSRATYGHAHRSYDGDPRCVLL